MSTIYVVPTMDKLPYDILMNIIQKIDTLNAVFLCRLEQVSKSFQLCANNTETWNNVYNTSKKQVRDWFEDATKRQIVSIDALKQATANRDASLSIMDERTNSLARACEHCCVCDPRTIYEIINEQIHYMSQYKTKPIKNLLDELTQLIINNQCTTLCSRKTGHKYKGFASIHDKKSDAILSWKCFPLVQMESNIIETRDEFEVCNKKCIKANIGKMMIARYLVEPEYLLNKPKNTQN